MVYERTVGLTVNTVIQVFASIINFVLLIGGLVVFVLLLVVLIKANKALNIWLKRNKEE